MNAVGIDVSKGKSTVTIRRPGDVVLMPPRDIPHTKSAINDLIGRIRSLDGETKVCMEHTGRYYEPVATWLSDAGIFVSAVNPILIREFGDDSLRTPKTDKADSKKIARYTLDRWAKLKQYGNMDKIRNQFKTMNRQFGFYMDQKIDPARLTKLDTTEIVIPYGAGGAGVPEQKYRDVLKLLYAMTDGRTAYCVVGIENQAEIHYALPVRNGVYDFLQLSHQVSEAASAHRQAMKEMKSERSDDPQEK